MRHLTVPILIMSCLALAGAAFGFQQTDALATNALRETAKTITARGHVDCATVSEVCCQVSSSNRSVVRIAEIVPEGSLVKEGQILVKLDAHALEAIRTRQQILCATSEASLTKAENESQLAMMELESYTHGFSQLERRERELAILVAEEYLRRAKQELEDVEKLSEDTPKLKRHIEATRFAALKAEKELELARLKLEVFEKYAHRKTLKQLESMVEAAKVRSRADQLSYRVNAERLQQIESQMEGCVIKAPAAGRVLYATSGAAGVENTQAGMRPMLSKGASVRRGQPLLSIQDPKKMQLKVVIPETKASQVKAGAAATVRVDAFPDLELKGVVENLVKLPAGAKPAAGPQERPVCEATVRIIDPPENLLSGLTGEVTIRPDGPKADSKKHPQSRDARQ